MDEFPINYLRHLHFRLGEAVFGLARLNVWSLPAGNSWHPSVNVYECPGELVICVDLAGVTRSEIDLRVEPQCVNLRGYRGTPEPDANAGRPTRILAMEIDHGAFERNIALPVKVNPDGVRAEHRRGILWIYLPVSVPAQPSNIQHL